MSVSGKTVLICCLQMFTLRGFIIGWALQKSLCHQQLCDLIGVYTPSYFLIPISMRAQKSPACSSRALMDTACLNI